MPRNVKVKDALKKANILSRRYRHLQIFIAFLWGIRVLFSMINTIIYKNSIDSLIAHNISNKIFIWIGVAIGLSILGIILNFLSEYLLDFTAAKVKGDIWENMLYKYLRRKDREDILSKMVGDVEYVSQISAGFIPSISIQIIRIVGAALILLYMNIWLALIVFATSAIHVVLYKKLSPKVVQYSFEERTAYDDIVEELREKVEGKYTIWKFFSAEFFYTKFKNVRESWTEKIKNLIFKEKEYTILSMGMGNVSPWIVLLAGIYMIRLNLTTIGTVVAVFYITPSIYEPLTNLSSSLAVASQATAPIDRVWTALKPVEEHRKGYNKRREDVKSIEIKDVAIGYDKPLIEIKELKVKKGDKIGIVGPSGAGKSTFIKTIACLQKPLKGTIKINNNDKCMYEDYNIYLVEENDMLFRGTVKENICMGESYSKKELKNVVNLCSIDDVDLNDFVDLRGSNLSLGQRQRICLARALIRRPSLLIIDEGLSGVDSERENRILRNIMDEYPEMTLVVVSHRLSTILNMDRIFVIYKGNFEEVDKVNFLRSKKYEFIKSQIIT